MKRTIEGIDAEIEDLRQQILDLQHDINRHIGITRGDAYNAAAFRSYLQAQMNAKSAIINATVRLQELKDERRRAVVIQEPAEPLSARPTEYEGFSVKPATLIDFYEIVEDPNVPPNTIQIVEKEVNDERGAEGSAGAGRSEAGSPEEGHGGRGPGEAEREEPEAGRKEQLKAALMSRGPFCLEHTRPIAVCNILKAEHCEPCSCTEDH